MWCFQKSYPKGLTGSILLAFLIIYLSRNIECKILVAAPLRSPANPRNSVIFSFDKPMLVGPVNYFDGMWVPVPAPSERMYRSHLMTPTYPSSPIAFDGDIFYTTNSELLEPIPMQPKSMRSGNGNHVVPYGRASRYHEG
ncbi:unnamed protein product [Allacma fusca]|uniref:Uncharacterized protein n=1 Tax=Allacma fusca TaxID=39272 RepID=A0A8J2PP54_9HEXA|nr:unnamed protein product [Allacma fusca]